MLIINPRGVVFSGRGISGITITPFVAGLCDHTINYAYSDAYCTNSADEMTTVSDYDFKAGDKLITSTIGWCSINAQYTSVGRTADGLKGSCWNNGHNYNHYFKF